MMEESSNQSRYVKLTKDQAPLEEDIVPGELNQPIEVPQLAVRKCHECRQPLPESYAPPADEPWMTGIFACAEDRESCLTGLFCPCVLFGRNFESLREDVPWTGPCICHAIFVEGGISLAIATVVATSVISGIDPGTTCLIYEGLFFTWWMCGIHNGQVRQTLQKKYHLKNSPCSACCVHCCLHWCALCQEHREMKGRLSDNVFSEMTVVNPPPIQEMKSTDNDDKENPETSSANNNEHTDLEMHPI
ncbi:cell number regulator 6-like [Lotus japonicus]|uniref:Cell number regulator 6 n=1 Tax=Lotus japonicus TaxID=34305 RepID=I3SSP8_LOTJA|nr:cell number regulator 6-like [Lotus japonicus]AFK43290.1 unknown [Lotus japonicus]